MSLEADSRAVERGMGPRAREAWRRFGDLYRDFVVAVLERLTPAPEPDGACDDESWGLLLHGEAIDRLEGPTGFCVFLAAALRSGALPGTCTPPASEGGCGAAPAASPVEGGAADPAK